MLIGDVVENQIHDNADIAFAGLLNQAVHVLHGSEHFVDRAVICDVIAVVGLRRLEAWGQPDGADTQLFQIVEFFRDTVQVALVAVCAALLITFLIRAVGKREENPLILNFLISCVAEFFIILSVRLGFGHHTGYITLGAVMLLISALGATNGLRDLVHLDTLSGVMNITASLTGAIGIALGIALPLSLLRGWAGNELTGLNPSVPIQLISCTIACVGFALWFHVRGRHVPWCGLGALLTWAAYRVALQFDAGVFTATLFASAFCGLYGQVMARVNRAPATIFLTVSIFPLIPGAALYYMMYGIVTRNAALSIGKGAELLLSCFGIVLGYMAVEVLNKYIWRHHGQ